MDPVGRAGILFSPSAVIFRAPFSVRNSEVSSAGTAPSPPERHNRRDEALPPRLLLVLTSNRQRERFQVRSGLDVLAVVQIEEQLVVGASVVGRIVQRLHGKFRRA